MKSLSILLAGLLLMTTSAPLSQAGPKGKQAPGRAEQVKAGVARLGVGEAARVEVRLHDGTKLRGYVKEAGADGFVVVDRKTGAETPVAYEQVRQLGGQGMSTGVKVAIGFGVAAVVLLSLALIGLHYAD
jgi:hypothetical protein